MEELGRFQLLRELGSSSFAVTYEAQDGAQRCALKVLKDEAVPDDPTLRAGLVEALAGLKAIEHPSVVRVLDSGEEEGRLFVATEFLDAPTLEQLLGEGPLEEQQVVLFVRQMAQALDKARDTGYCHGDLTLTNAFVVSPEKIKLSDFAVKALVQNPPDVSALEGSGGIEAEEDEWVTAEDLLRSQTTATVAGSTEEDLADLACMAMQMLGVELAPRAEGEDLDAYRQRLLDSGVAQISDGDGGCSVHTAEVIRRLVTEGGFDTPGEVVVELASAMLLGRTLGRARTPAAGPSAPGAETAQVTSEPAPITAVPAGPTSSADLEGLEFKGDPREAPFTPFFIWTDRRGGRFIVLHDGERLSLGRDPDLADLTLMDPAISRRHCYLVKEGGTITVEDAGSSNGTFVNDERIEKAEIGPTDAVRVGTTRIYMTVVTRDQ